MKEMREEIKNYIAVCIRNRNRRRKTRMVLSVLSVFVTVGVFLQLMQPAITITAEPICGMSEHKHTEKCFESVLVCGQGESRGHTHGNDCYEQARILVCTQTDEEHVHADECYHTQKKLICAQEEGLEHKHTGDCYSQELVCGQTEHLHKESCYPEKMAEPTISPQDLYESMGRPETEQAEDVTPLDIVTERTPEPTLEPTPQPTPEPTAVPTAVPETTPESAPDVTPTPEPMLESTAESETGAASVLLSELTGPSRLVSGERAEWKFSAAGAEKLCCEILDAKDALVFSETLPLDASCVEWVAEDPGMYRVRVKASNAYERKTVETNFAVSGGRLDAQILTDAKYCFAGEKLALSLAVRGGVAPLKSSVKIVQGGKILYENAEASDGIFEVETAECERATELKVTLEVTDAAGDTVQASHSLPCPVREAESRSQWERTFADVRMSEDWAENLLMIADTQLGYRESEENFIIDADGKKQGYTRYGDWYGANYREWCAMFVSFCLHYAEIPEHYFPQQANCAKWVKALKAEELYIGARNQKENGEKYVPNPGDLVFFDWKEDRQDGKADHVGIVYRVSGNKVTTIEGNSGKQVRTRQYALTDKVILGYGKLQAARENYRMDHANSTETATAAPTVAPANVPEEGDIPIMPDRPTQNVNPSEQQEIVPEIESADEHVVPPMEDATDDMELVPVDVLAVNPEDMLAMEPTLDVGPDLSEIDAAEPDTFQQLLEQIDALTPPDADADEKTWNDYEMRCMLLRRSIESALAAGLLTEEEYQELLERLQSDEPDIQQIQALEGEVRISGNFDAALSRLEAERIQVGSAAYQEYIRSLMVEVLAQGFEENMARTQLYELSFAHQGNKQAASFEGMLRLDRTDGVENIIAYRVAHRTAAGWEWLETHVTEEEGQKFAVFQTNSFSPFAVVSFVAREPEQNTATDLKDYVERMGGTFGITLRNLDDTEIAQDENGSKLLAAGQEYRLVLALTLPKGEGFAAGRYVCPLPTGLRYLTADGEFMAADGSVFGEWSVSEAGLMRCTFYENAATFAEAVLCVTCSVATDADDGTVFAYSLTSGMVVGQKNTSMIRSDAQFVYAAADRASDSLELEPIIETLKTGIAIEIKEEWIDMQGEKWYKYAACTSYELLNRWLEEFPYIPASDVESGGNIQEQTLQASVEGGIEIAIQGLLPDGAALTASRVNHADIQNVQTILQGMIADCTIGDFAFACDIDLGGIGRLSQPVTVTVDNFDLGYCDYDNLAARVYHIHMEKDWDIADPFNNVTVTEIEGATIDKKGIVFQTDGFSIFYFALDIVKNRDEILNTLAESASGRSLSGSSGSNTAAEEPAERARIYSAQPIAVKTDLTDEPSDQQVKKQGGTNTSPDGAVRVSKTIDGTDIENVFDITLQVQTEANIEEFYREPDIAVVVVMDISNTMYETFGDTRRYLAATAAAEDFVNRFAESSAGVSRIGYVAFNTDAHQIFALSDCSTAEQASSLINTMKSKTSAIITSSGYAASHSRFTNIEAGLKMAQDMLKDASNENKAIIFLSDGFPTTYISHDYVGYDPYCTGGTVGNDGVFYDDVLDVYCKYGTSYSDKAAIKARERATAIKNSGTMIFSIGIDIGGQTIQQYVNRSETTAAGSERFSIVDRSGTTYELGSATSTDSFKNWLKNSIGSGYYYDSTNQTGIEAAYDQIFEEIRSLREESSQAIWVAEDPMPRINGQETVEFIGFYDKTGNFVGADALTGVYEVDGENTVAYTTTDKISWDLKKSGYVLTETGNTKTYTYTLVYRVRLENENEDFVEAQNYLTNGTTVLSYQTLESVDGNVSISDPQSVEFPIPEVEGYLAELSFRKVDNYGRPVAGAEFTLTHDVDHCGVCRGDGETAVSVDPFTATSDADGTVSFINIPSGHRYTLEETTIPAGYLKSDDTYSVVVAYDVLAVTVTHPDGTTTAWDVNGSDEILNTTAYELPQTGGSGTLGYTIGGIIIMMCGLLYGCATRRKRGKEENR